MLNVITMQGRLVAEPEYYRDTENENLSIVRYRIAVDRDYKTDGKRPTDFFLCKAYGRLAEYAKEYFRQGDTITLSGRLYTWLHKQAGEDKAHIYTTIHVNSHYLTKRRSEQGRERVMNPAEDPTGSVIEEKVVDEFLDLPPLPPELEEEPYEVIYADYQPPIS